MPEEYSIEWYDVEDENFHPAEELPGWPAGLPGTATKLFGLRPAIRELLGRGFSNASYYISRSMTQKKENS